MFGIRPSLTEIREKLHSSIHFFLVLSKSLSPIVQGRDSTADGVIRTLSRIGRAFINIPMAEARDFHCYSHVFENLGKRSIPSDHAAVRVVHSKADYSGTPGQTHSELDVQNIPSSVLFLKRLDDDHQYPADPCGALADFKNILEKAKRQTVRELSRKTPDSLGAKLLTASTVLRAYPISFECIDFHGLSQIIASVTRENLAEREAEKGNLSRTQTEKDNALANCRLGLRAWHAKKPMLCLHAVTEENGHPLENEDESGRRLCEFWGTIFQARVEGQRHHYENILRYVQKAPDDIRWIVDNNEFDELMATKESAPGRDGITYSFYRCAGRLGSQVLFNAYKHVVEGGTIPALFTESRTVFIPKSSDVDNHGRIVRSPEVLAPIDFV